MSSKQRLDASPSTIGRSEYDESSTASPLLLAATDDGFSLR
jgi:hypothetical protein